LTRARFLPGSWPGVCEPSGHGLRRGMHDKTSRSTRLRHDTADMSVEA